MLLPYVLKAYGHTVHASLYRLALAAGVAEQDDSPQMGARRFIGAIEALNERLGIPRTIAGIRREDIAQLARYADKEANPLYPVPKLMDAKELEQFYTAVMEETT